MFVWRQVALCRGAAEGCLWNQGDIQGGIQDMLEISTEVFCLCLSPPARHVPFNQLKYEPHSTASVGNDFLCELLIVLCAPEVQWHTRVYCWLVDAKSLTDLHWYPVRVRSTAVLNVFLPASLWCQWWAMVRCTGLLFILMWYKHECKELQASEKTKSPDLFCRSEARSRSRSYVFIEWVCLN